MSEKERWRLPESMVRHEGGRFVVDTAPAFGKLLVLWDGDGLVLRAVEPVSMGLDSHLRRSMRRRDYGGRLVLA